MSQSTWEATYYWIRSADLVRHPKATDAHLVKHSLLKWTGLRTENLRAHNYSPLPYQYDAEESMCLRYQTRNAPTTNESCAGCPVAKFRGGISCQRPIPGIECQSPWGAYVSPKTGMPRTPESMIICLQRTYDQLPNKISARKKTK